MNLTPYEPRPLAPLGVVELGGFRLKAYSIVYGDAPFDHERFEAGLRLAERELPAPAVAPGRPGVGFVVLHQARTGPYLVVGWWSNENELPVRVFLEDAAGWRPATGGESFCVWDLRVVWHEREAYIRTMLGGEADAAAYLAAMAEGFA